MVVLYSTNCPRCKVLEQKLNDKGVDFSLVEDENKIIELGYTSAPLLSVDDKVMDFNESMTWVTSL